jgi:glucose/arabinose dehydrogenase
MKKFFILLLLSIPAFAADQKPTIALKQIAASFVSPTVFAQLPDGRLLVGDQVGVIYIVSGTGGLTNDTIFLDLRPKLTKLNQGFDERGLLGLALHPQFKENQKLYVYYSAPKRPEAPADWDHTSHLSEFKADKDKVDLSTERLLLQIDQPYFNHNSGRLAFGPDGYLYIASGDGGNANDQGKRPPTGNGQDLNTLLGKILRIDVNGPTYGNAYAIPQDNPFIGGGRPEIYAYGLRNPWSLTFDRGGKRELFAADVGQDRFEELNIITKGGNYGWNIREGFGCFDPKAPKNPPEDCPKKAANGDPLLDPVLAYKSFRAFAKDPEATGISVTGGYVYRGKALPELQGKYVFADWSRNWAVADGVLLVASPGAENKWTFQHLQVEGFDKPGIRAYVTAFGEDNEGELYVLTNGRNSLTGATGKAFKIIKPTSGS